MLTQYPLAQKCRPRVIRLERVPKLITSDALLPFSKPITLDTLYFGGGTPTQLPPDKLRALVATVREWFPLASNYEFSVEANPADLNETMLAALVEPRRAGRQAVPRLADHGQSA